MELTDFLHVDTDLQILKADQIFFGWAWSKMDVASLVTGLSKNEKMEQINFLHAGANSGKLKVDSLIFGWVIAMAFSSCRDLKVDGCQSNLYVMLNQLLSLYKFFNLCNTTILKLKWRDFYSLKISRGLS